VPLERDLRLLYFRSVSYPRKVCPGRPAGEAVYSSPPRSLPPEPASRRAPRPDPRRRTPPIHSHRTGTVCSAPALECMVQALKTLRYHPTAVPSAGLGSHHTTNRLPVSRHTAPDIPRIG